MLDKNLLKRGQISIFIIISIILVIISIFMIYNSELEIFMSSDTKLKNQVSDVVNNCLDESANQGVFLLGFQGGRLNIGPEILSNPKKYANLGMKIPVWDSTVGGVPTVESMTSELNNFMLINAKECIVTNLKSLDDYFDISYNGNLSINSEINPENIVVEANLPIVFNEKNSDQILSVEDFFIEIESKRLADMLSLAKQIYSIEESSDFVEDLVIDQIYSASDYSDTKLSMPSEGMSISCAPKIWTINTLKKNLANLNNNNFKYLHFDGTYSRNNLYDVNFNDDLGTTSLKDYFLAHYNFELSDKKSSYSNYKVEFVMPSSEITGEKGYFKSYPYREFEVTPSSGNIVKSLDMNIGTDSKIPIPCIQIFHHLYSLDYDLIVRISDMNDDGDNFLFQFPLRVLIENNEPKVARSTPVIERDFGALTSDKYCANDQPKYPMDIYVTDEVSGDYLSDVNISYSCLSYSCDMGLTEKPKFNGITRIYSDPFYHGEFPFCYNGYVKAEKDGYHFSSVMIKTDESLLEDNGGYTTISLRAKKEFSVDKGTFLNVDRETKKGHRIFSEDDGQIFVSIENKALDFESFVYWPVDSTYDIYNKLELLDGIAVYNISIIYADKNGALKGMYQVDNKVINSNLGNTLQITVPSTIKKITEDNYLEFFDYMTTITSISDTYGLNIVS